MLAAIGEAPVNSLGTSGLVDAATAYDILNKVTREVQTKGWNFNFEQNYPLPIDIHGYVYLPSNVLAVSIGETQKATYTVAQRGTRLYNRKTHTFVFTETIYVDIITLLQFSDMPEAAKNYVVMKAARRFCQQMVGSAELEGFAEKDEMAALDTLKDFEGDTSDYNMLVGSYDVFRVIDRLGPNLQTFILQ